MRKFAFAVLVAAASPALAEDEAVPQPELAKEIVIVASRREEPASSAVPCITSFGAADFERLRPFSVADVLRETPGAYVSSDGTPGQFTRVFLRGAASNQTLVLVDGIPQNDATAGGLYDFGDLGMTGVERIEVLRGSYSVLYGSEAIGGVVSVTTRRGRGAPSGYAIAQVGSFGTRREEAGFSSGDDAFDFAFAVGDSASDGDIDRERFREHDAVGRFGVELTDVLRFDGSLRAAQSSVESPYDFASSGVLPEDDDIGRRRQTISGGGVLTWDASRDLTVRAIASGLNVESSFDNGPDGVELVDPDFTPGTGDEFRAFRDELESRNTATDLRGRLEATWVLARQPEDTYRRGFGLTVTGGGEHLEQRTISTTTSPNFGAAGSSTTRSDDTTRTASLFVQADARLPDLFRGRDFSAGFDPHDVIVSAGLRDDDHNVFGSESSPYVGMRAKVEEVDLRSNYGQGFRAPKASELYDPFVGNASLGAETSESFDAGASRAFADGGVVLGVTWFRLDVDGLIAYDADAVTPSRPFGQLTNFSRTRTDGFEYETAAKLGGGFGVRGTYTTQNPRDRDTGLPLPNRARRFGSAGVSWEEGPVRVSLDGFFSGENGNQGGEFSSPDADARSHPGRRTLVDLTVNWQAGRGVTVFGGIRNLLDDEWVATPSSPAGSGIGVYVGAQVEF